jgi:hypothetical protein
MDDDIASNDDPVTKDQFVFLLVRYEIEWNDEPVNENSVIRRGIDFMADYDTAYARLFKIGNSFRKTGVFENDKPLHARYNRVMEKFYYMKNMMKYYFMLDKSVNTDTTDVSDEAMMVIPFGNENKLKSFQKMVINLLDVFERKRYRKIGGDLYEEIRNTHAWERSMSIHEFVHKNCSMAVDYENWFLMTSAKDMDKQLVNYFTYCVDDRLPKLEKNRNLFSFKNGIYISLFDEDLKEDKFIEYGTIEHTALSKNEVSCKYIDKVFRYIHETDPRKIPTPFLDSIYAYQDLSPEVVEINKMFLGRMLYDVGYLENWQVISMLLGSGGTGKSTIHNIVKMFYESQDIGIMSNNYQKIFGLSDIYDKFAFIAPEIKKDWSIDQAEFQEIVSGGKVNVNIKNKSSLNIEWKTPGMLAGNENPGFVDNASSIQRRMVCTRFDNKVKDGDPLLSKRLEDEIDCIMHQCNLYYLNFAKRYGDKDIWSWLPPYFIETQTMMACASNALIAFMNSDVVRYGEDVSVPMVEFWRRFNAFCSENNFRRPNITVDMYKSPFAKYGVILQKRVTKKYPNTPYGRMYKNATFLIGVCVSEDEEETIGGVDADGLE